MEDEKRYSLGGQEPKINRAERLGSILLKGRIYEVKEGESITLEAQGSLLTIPFKDVKEVRHGSGQEKELLVSSNAKIVYETVLNPIEVEGILSRDLVVEISSLVNKCVECSRCSGGECECSRCVDRTGLPFEGAGGGFRRRLT